MGHFYCYAEYRYAERDNAEYLFVTMRGIILGVIW